MILIVLASTAILLVLLVLFLLLLVFDGKIDAYALLQDKLYTLLADAMTEMDKLGGCTRSFFDCA